MCNANWYQVRREIQQEAVDAWNYKPRDYVTTGYKEYKSSVADVGYMYIPVLTITNDSILQKTHDGIYEYAHEAADNSPYVIYYGWQRELWADSADIRAYEDDAIDAGMKDVSSIQQYCVYMAISDTITETLNELMEEAA
jgi:hypothetical protein